MTFIKLCKSSCHSTTYKITTYTLMSVVNYANMPVMLTSELGTHWNHSVENLGHFHDCSW